MGLGEAGCHPSSLLSIRNSVPGNPGGQDPQGSMMSLSSALEGFWNARLGLTFRLRCLYHIPSDQTPPAVPTSSLPLSPPQSWLVTRATFVPSAHSASLLTAPGNKDRGQEGRCSSCTMPPSLPLPLSLLKYQVCPLPCPNKEPLSY